ncbi:DMT family transporter [Vampirovibrio sp.]|uniref:DMT family transporter n=1 Tax=Vampirovibrio sp. TaxID=2717857 RepID=UPI0035941829
MSERLSAWKPYMALLAVYVIWGTTTGAIHLGVTSIPSAVLPCSRFLLAGSLLTAFCLFKGQSFPRWADLKTHAIVGFLLFFAGNSIVCWTVKYMSTGFGSVLVATTPLWMTLLSALLPPRERIPGLSLLGIFIGFGGMLILLSPQLTHLRETTDIFWMCMLGLAVMTFCWALGSIYVRKHPTQDSLLMSVGVQNLVAGVLLLPVCWLTVPDWSAVHPTGTSISAWLYLTLFGTMVATPCYLFVLKALPVSVSSTFAYVTPVLTVIFGAMFLNETVTPTMAVGAAVILCGVSLVQVMNRQQWAGKNRPKVFSPDELEVSTSS